MKKLIYLFLTLFTAVAYGQADFPEGVQISGGQPTTTTDPYITTTGSTGLQGKVSPINMPVTITPPTTFYTPVTSDLKGHLQGIDNALGDIPLTTAGNTTRVWFTGDATTIGAGTFYLTNAQNKGTVANVSQSVINDDDQKKYFTQDLIGNAFATTTIFPPGVYAGNLSGSTTPNSARQKFTVELYRCDTNGTPIASGVAGAPVGDLGVTVIIILDSGELTLADGSVTNVSVSANLATSLTINVGERIRYHVSAAKVGTNASNITESVWYGNSFNSFLDVPTPITSSGVSNLSTVTGATVTTALDNLNTGKENAANKQNSLATDGTGVKLPTVDAVSGGTTYKRTIAQIRALSGTLPNTNFYTTDLGQEGNWYYDASDVTSADNTGTILVTADGKRIKRSISGYINVKWFGAKGDNTQDDTSSINNAIQYVENKFGGTLFFPSGVYKVSSRIIGRRSVVLKGEGGFDYSGMPTQYGTCIKPTVGFSSTEVMLFDSNTDSTPLFSGAGIEDFAIDMDNISASGKSGIVIRSGSNLGFMKNIVVNRLDNGSELVLDGSSFSGSLATDGLEISSFFTYGKTVGYSSSIPRLLVKGNVNEVNFRGCKFQSKSGAVSGTISAYVGTGARGIVFDGCSFAGNEIGLKIESTLESSSPPEWIRVINSTFETYRYGVYVDATIPNSSFFPKRISVESGNRFIGAIGTNVRNVYLGKSIGSSVILDEYVEAGTSGTSLLCEITSNAISAVVNAQPTQVSNSSTTSAVNGRINNHQSFNKLQISGANGDNDLILKNSSGSTANGVLRWRGSDDSNQAAIASNYTIGDIGALEFLNGNTLNAYLSSVGVFRLPNLSGTGTRTVVADASGNLSATAAAPDSGTYTPTLDNTVNVTSTTLNVATYTRVGNIVTVMIGLTTNITSASTNSQISISLPFNKAGTSVLYGGNFTGREQAGTTDYYSGIFQTITSNTTQIRMYFKPISSGVNTITGTFSYQL